MRYASLTAFERLVGFTIPSKADMLRRMLPTFSRLNKTVKSDAEPPTK